MMEDKYQKFETHLQEFLYNISVYFTLSAAETENYYRGSNNKSNAC